MLKAHARTVLTSSQFCLAEKISFFYFAGIKLRQRGASIRAIAKQLGVGVGTVTRTLLERSRIA